MDLNFDPTRLIVSLFPSAIGFVLFTYFTPTLGIMLAGGVTLAAALYLLLALGW